MTADYSQTESMELPFAQDTPSIDQQILSAQRKVERELGTPIENFNRYHNGFAFTVSTELDAYKAAYKYQHCERVTVKYAPSVSQWHVSIYTKRAD